LEQLLQVDEEFAGLAALLLGAAARGAAAAAQRIVEQEFAETLHRPHRETACHKYIKAPPETKGTEAVLISVEDPKLFFLDPDPIFH
jgi:hypothetical protein